MIIHVKDKNTLIIDDFKLKCCIGKNGINSNKKEGDYSTPRGLFTLQKLYFRKDRVEISKCKIQKKIIKNTIERLNHTIKILKKVYIDLTKGMII